jgi:Transglutaminase-like superfamily/TgpA N-terminal domain
MGRTIAVYVFPAALIAVGWLRLEEARAPGADWLWVVLLALLPALAPALWLRLALVAPAALVAAWVALDTPAIDDRPGFFGPVLDRFWGGVGGFYDVSVPFSALEHQRMHGVVLLAIFGFCLVLAQSIAARRPLSAVLAVIAGAGWPAALYASSSIAYGVMILAAALWVLAGLRTTRPVPALVAGAVLVVLAAGASSSAAVAKEGVLDWEQWTPGGAGVPVSVSYVWEGTYGGIEFAKKKTTVLRITGPKRGLYWRATTLDQFDSDRWLENPTPLSTGPAVGRLPDDPLLPTRSLNRRTWIRQDVEIVGLRDTHIVAAAQPVALDAPSLGGVFRLSDGLVRVYRGLRRGQEYTAYSYAPRPGPAELAVLEADYPPALDRFLDIGRTRVDAFGVPGRDRLVDSLFADERYIALWPYEAMWEQAQRLRADARTPYGAVVAIETWLRSTGGFAYDETPPTSDGLPPLAHFVADGKRGYCQHFAGAMALMLRMLGIPARVAAGFTSGTYEDGGWTVTDHNAHAWVEVWFPDYGWLPFDPTPGRGSLAARYSASSTGFNAGDAADGFVGGAGRVDGGGIDQLRLLEQKERLAEQAEAARRAADDGRSNLWLLVLLAVAAVVALGVAKLVRRRSRYLTRDPRRLAGAARRELVDFLADQGVAVGVSATPEELHQLVQTEYGADGRPFARALAAARYGPPEASADAAASARRELRGLLRALRDALSRTARLRGMLALRSLRT